MTIKRIPLAKKEDDRGWLVENESNIIRYRMKHFLVSVSKPDVIRGQHYHKRKTEWFLVLKGKALIVFEDIKSLEGKRIEVDGDRPEIIEASPMIAHSIKNIGNDNLYLMAVVSEPLDLANPDTFAYNVLK